MPITPTNPFKGRPFPGEVISGTFGPRTKAARAITLRDRIEDAPCATAWKRFLGEQAPQMDLQLEAVGNY